jgi:hypothetical protein
MCSVGTCHFVISTLKTVSVNCSKTWYISTSLHGVTFQKNLNIHRLYDFKYHIIITFRVQKEKKKRKFLDQLSDYRIIKYDSAAKSELADDPVNLVI